ncbi:hypothetical protein [Ruegeria sp.]|uniref:hypothetical protein n=1 Tax=Ruegeria sp. TaxID=1879320 RepID=UPI003B5A06A6
MRHLFFLIAFLTPSVLQAQSTATIQPQVIVEAPSEDVIVGQSTILRIKVLVPTFMPSPPVFPSLEQENLLVRLPERASGPVSETVDGETWSGVQRSYRLYPLISGAIEFGANNVTVTFADPETNAPTQVSVPLQPITINAVIPEGARDLDPLIIANGFDLEQEVEGNTELQAGDAITRRLTARITGTSPLLIPPLIPENQDPLLRPYPKEPRFTETEDRGILSGQRAEETVYLAQDGGDTQLPPVSIQWYNLTTNAVETAEAEAVDLQLAAPRPKPPTTEELIKYVIWAGVVALAAWFFARWTTPRYRVWQDARQRAYHASPDFALKQLKQALRDHDLSDAYTALETWKSRCSNPAGFAALEAQLIKVGAAVYGEASPGNTPDWSAALSALDSLVTAPDTRPHPLPPLNP